MSLDQPPVILLRWCKDRACIRLTEEYLKSWYEKRTTPIRNNEVAYNELVSDFLNTDISVTSEPVIQENFGQMPTDTFPMGPLRHGGGVILQIQDTNDISNSTFSLLNNLSNSTPVRQTYIERTEGEEVNFSRGMLRWTLTDGARQIQAMEMETLAELDLKTPFGCKLLIKNCQVKRGMILLNKNNVKVLGGDVPQLYAGNMITELETRFKAKLGMIEEPNTPVPAEPSTRSERLVDDIEDFDDDDINYDALDMVESVNVQTNIPEEPIHQFNDDDDFMDALPHISPPRQSMLSLSRKRSIQQTQQQHRSSPPPPPPSQKRNRTDDESSSIEIPKIKPENSMNNTQDDSADLSWVDASVWDNLLANKDDDMELDENGKAHCSFETLLKTLKAMEQGNHTENIADIVTVKVRCIKMAKLRMSSKTGFYLEIVIGDPVDIDMDTVKVIFTNEIITKALGVDPKFVSETLETSGKQAVAKKIFTPLQTKVQSGLTNLSIDLTVLESDTLKNENKTSPKLMPLVVGYEPCI